MEKQHCIIHPIRKRPITLVDELTERIGCLNVILAYQKLNDDVIDNNKGRLKRCFFKGVYKRAKKAEPILDSIVSKRYKELLEYEKRVTYEEINEFIKQNATNEFVSVVVVGDATKDDIQSIDEIQNMFK